MAKGDQSRYQNTINYQGGLAQNNLDNLRNNMGNTQGTFWNNYNTGVGMNLASYDEIMGRYRDFLGGGGSLYGGAGAGASGFSAPTVSAERVGLNPEWMNHVRSALGGYQNFADTGGFSTRNLQDIRARAIAPTRSVYSSAQNNIARQRALQGGYSPNYTAASAKMTRDLAQQISDANVSANASIAQMVQQGKLAGLGGLSTTGLGAAGLNLQADTANQEAALRASLANATNSLAGRAYDLQGRGQDLNAINAMGQLYGTRPGLIETFGDQVLRGQGQAVDLQNLQNQLSLGTMRAQQERANIPGNFQAGLGNLSGILGAIGTGWNIYQGIRGGGNTPTIGGGQLPQYFPPRQGGTNYPGVPNYTGPTMFNPSPEIGIPGAGTGFNYQGGNLFNPYPGLPSYDSIAAHDAQYPYGPFRGQIRPTGSFGGW